MVIWLYVTCFGIIGISLRFFLDGLAINLKFSFPWHTLFINVIGCFIAGAIFNNVGIGLPLRIGLLVGFCGGFTTFSALSMQAYLLAQSGEIISALVYLITSQVLGLIAIYLGSEFGRLVL